MNRFNIAIAIIFFLSLCAPVYTVVAQETATESQETVSEERQLSKKEYEKFLKWEKKKKEKEENNKDKNEVDIDKDFLFCLLIDVATMLLIILFIYYPNNKQRETIFTFIMFNLMIFMLTLVFNKIKMSIGAAFGLFAVFSMLRYRTEGITMKDMTYLFIFIGIGLISAIQLEFHTLGIIMGIVILFTFFLESSIILKHEYSKLIEYENIEYIKPENYENMLNDLRQRTGLKIHRATVEQINFLKDTAKVKIYYR